MFLQFPGLVTQNYVFDCSQTQSIIRHGKIFKYYLENFMPRKSTNSLDGFLFSGSSVTYRINVTGSSAHVNQIIQRPLGSNRKKQKVREIDYRTPVNVYIEYLARKNWAAKKKKSLPSRNFFHSAVDTIVTHYIVVAVET